MEAAANMSYAQIALSYTELALDSLTLPFASGASVANNEVYATYNALASVLAPLTNGSQHVVVVDVVEPAVGATSLTVIYQLGSGYERGAPNSTYTSVQDYKWGITFDIQPSSQCVCGQNPNSSDYCANKIIQQRIYVANVLGLSPGQYVTDVELWKVDRYLTDIAAKHYQYSDPLLAGPAPLGDGYRDTKTYFQTSSTSNPSPCLQEGDMQFWTGNASTGTWSAITTIKAAHCPTKLLLSTYISSYTWLPPGSSFANYMHECQFTFCRVAGGGGGGQG